MLGIRTGMYSEDPDIVFLIDSAMDFLEDEWPKSNAYGIATLFAGGNFTEETQ